METIDSVLEFWFGKGAGTLEICAEKESTWWSKNSDFDLEVTNRFEETTRAVAGGERENWLQSDKGILASIIALDQFPRNMYRGSPKSFEYDPIARDLARRLINSGGDQELLPVYRCFAYLPFEHSEELADQILSVALYERLAADCEGEEKRKMQGNFEFAVKHLDFIQRFGRFPHRNVILGRESTEHELAFLNTPGSSF